MTAEKTIRRVLQGPCKGIMYRESDRGGLEYSDDNGRNWYLTFRSWCEVEAMHTSLEPAPSEPMTDEERRREEFGETLDEPIPDWAWRLIDTDQ